MSLSPEPTQRRSAPQWPARLPGEISSFVGRERELAEAREILARSRLLTLTGSGGTGKTRFAVRLVSSLADQYPDGVFFVGLAPIFDAELVLATIALALGVPEVRRRPPRERLVDYLREKRALLLLDNFEQVLEAGPQLLELLTECPRLCILVTSRIALRLSGEREYLVPPLTVPGLSSVPAEAERVALLGASEAVQLFVARAQSVRPEFELTPENASDIAEMCRRLDGLPLAIELAAARSRLLPPRTMLARLTRSSQHGAEHVPTEAVSPPLQFLSGGTRDQPQRQRTLRDTIAWSYNLLKPAEQALFRRLAAFVGGCTLDAAEAAGTATITDHRWTLSMEEVDDGIETLLASSLLQRTESKGGDPRFTLLETIREYGVERLAESGELRAMCRWHAGYFLGVAERAEMPLRGDEQAAWLDRLERDTDNFRAALEWTLKADAPAALRLSGLLAWFWASREYASEGRRWLERALAAPGEPLLRMKALYGAGFLAHIQRDSAAARSHLGAALALAQAADDRWATAWVLHLCGRVAYFDNDAPTARAYGERALAVAREVGDEWLVAWALHLLALAAQIAADYPLAWALYEESLTIRRRIGHTEGIGICLQMLGAVAYRQGEYRSAFSLARAGLSAMHAVRTHWTMNSLALMSALAVALQQAERGVRLAGAADAVSEAVRLVPIPLMEEMLAEALESARGALSAEDYAAAWAAGRGLTLDEAVAEGLAGEGDPPTRPRAAAPRDPLAPAGLTPREIEVLRLLASGRSTREIATDLVVSVATVERHITHIYDKIDARGRAEATAFALRHGLG